MSGFNFEKIGDIISEFFDSDLIDIKRDVNGNLQEIYSNIPCHLAFNSTDNPDPTSVDIKPIIQSINIHLPLWVDIKNNDFIVAKKMSGDGDLLKVYSGRCGNPIVSQGRQKVLMNMSSTEPETPTPIPPKNFATIKINYLFNNNPIQDSIEKKVGIGDIFSISAPIIEGYSADYCVIDGEKQDSAIAYISDVKDDGYIIDFVYSVSETPTIMRFLVNGLYTKDDGSLANGYHQYKKIDIDFISKSNETFTITCNNVKWVHDDNGKSLSIKIGVKLVLIPGNIFTQVSEIIGIENNKITFNAMIFEPTEAEKNSYVCGWYD